MFIPVRRRLRTKTPPVARKRVPSMGAVRRRMCSKGPRPGLLQLHQRQEEDWIHHDYLFVKRQEGHQVEEEIAAIQEVMKELLL